MNEILAFLNTIIKNYPHHEKLLLVSSMTRGYQILESLSLDLISGSNLRLVTLFDLALEILEPDINERQLKVISDKQINDILQEIIASLYGNKVQENTAAGSEIILKKIIRLRLDDNDPSLNPVPDRDIGWILNEYDLALEAGGFLDEAAVFDKAAGIIQGDSSFHDQTVLLVPECLKLSPAALRFLNTMKVETAY